MAIKSKVQIKADITADADLTSNQKVILGDVVDSYEDIFANVTTVQRDAIVTPSSGLVVYNIDTDRLEYWNGTAWFAVGQNVNTPITAKIVLSSAQLLALDSTGVTIAPAPGAGYAVIPTAAVSKFTYGSSQYTGSFNLVICSASNGVSYPFILIDGAQVKAAADRSSPATPQSSSSYISVVENDAIHIKSTGAIAAGDGTLTIWVTYSIIEW